MSFFETQARISKDPIVGLLQQAAADDSEDKLTAIIGSAADDNGKLIIPEAVHEASRRLVAEGIDMAYAPSTGLAGLAELMSSEILGIKTIDALVKLSVYRSELVTSGGTNAISTTLLACTSQDDQVITHNPHWAGYDSVALALGMKPLLNFDILDENQNFNFAAFEASIEKLIAEKADSKITIVLNTPFDNPLGKDFGTEAWSTIGDILAKHKDRQITIILDTAYLDFGPEGKDYRRLSFIPDLFRKINSDKFSLVIAGTMSKSFAMYGARVGVATLLTTNKENADNWRNAAGGTIRGTFSNACRFSQQIVDVILKDMNLLAHVHQFQHDTAKLINERKDVFIKAMQSRLSEEFEIIKPDSGFFISLKISDKPFQDSTFADVFYKKLVESHFYAPLISGQYLRIPTCGLNQEKLWHVADRILKTSGEVLASK